MPTVPSVAVSRPSHTIVVAGEDIAHLYFDGELDLYGDLDLPPDHDDNILSSLGAPFSFSWGVAVDRVPPHADDKYPLSMPATIANAGIRGRGHDGGSAGRPHEVGRIVMYHLWVQEPARREGYAQVLWDLYLALTAFTDADAGGNVGSTEGGGTVGFLKSQGVPADDISPGRHSPGEGSGTVGWLTDGENITSGAPITRGTVEVPDGAG